MTVALTTDLAAWNAALDGGSAATQTEVANRLEGQGARLRANITGSARLAGTTEFVAALAAYDSAAPPADACGRTTERCRPTRRTAPTSDRALVALVFGKDARPRFTART